MKVLEYMVKNTNLLIRQLWWFHQKYNKHKWKEIESFQYKWFMRGDSLPENLTIFSCKCGGMRREYYQMFTHFSGGEIGQLDKLSVRYEPVYDYRNNYYNPNDKEPHYATQEISVKSPAPEAGKERNND